MARNTEFVILGMLQFEPMSGYQIRQDIKRDLGGFWSESDGQLYPALKRLLESDEIQLLDIPQQTSRAKKVYQITDAGMLRLRKWLTQPVATDTIRNEFCLKIFFAGGSDVPGIIDLIQSERIGLKHGLRAIEFAYQEIEAIDVPEHQKHKRYWRATARYGECIMAAKLRWCDEILQELSEDGELDKK